MQFIFTHQWSSIKDVAMELASTKICRLTELGGGIPGSAPILYSCLAQCFFRCFSLTPGNLFHWNYRSNSQSAKTKTDLIEAGI